MRRIRRPVLAVALLVALVTGVLFAAPAGAAVKPASTSPGSIEICKSGANGMTGKVFQFTLNGGSPISVTAGGCSSAQSAPAGVNTVQELIPSGDQIAGIRVKPVVRLIAKNKKQGTVTVNVPSGSTGHRETVVTYTNEPQGGLTGTLKVCKIAGDPSLVGDLFSFTENGGPSFSIAAGTGSGTCSSLTSWPVGTVVTVAEQPTAGTQASAISVSDGRGSGTDLVDGTVQATIGSGVTTVTYTNIPTPPPQTGYIEVCKYAWDDDPWVSGSFQFTITAPGGFSDSQSVQVTQCTGPIQVPTGPVNVAETPRFPYQVAEIDVTTGRLVSENLGNGTVEVTVPQGDSSTETVVNYYNATLTGQLKICKTLTSNSQALAGDTQYFDYWYTFDGVVYGGNYTTIVLGNAGTTSCRLLSGSFPLGTQVSIVEPADEIVRVDSVTVSPAANDNGSTGTQANLVIGSGITTATFTNEALGTIEICKNVAATGYNQDGTGNTGFPFQFSVNGGAPITVQSGTCSPAMQVPAGTATIEELAANNFHFVSLTATGPAGDNRVVSGPATDAQGNTTVTVSVPFGGVGNETLITYVNNPNTGKIKICKVDPNASTDGLANYQFTFVYQVEYNQLSLLGTVDLAPGQCWIGSIELPVVDSSGNPIDVTVSELEVGSVTVTGIDYAGNGRLELSTFGVAGDGGSATFSIGQGVNQIAFTNSRSPLAPD